MAKKFNVFFKEKVKNLAAGIKTDPDINPFSRLKEKVKDLNLKFNLKTVSEEAVLKILRLLKSKKSSGNDGITAEIIKMGSKVLVVPLTYIINFSIVTGKFPSN